MKTSFCQSILTLCVAVALTAGVSSAAVPAMTVSHGAGLNLPLPDPNSGKSPFFHLNLPEPDPNSGKSPFIRLNLPEPDPNSGKSPF